MFQKIKVELPIISKKEYSILEFGAVSGGTVRNTKTFAKAIEAASVTGGRVVVPDGIWLTGPLELKSGVELHLEDNAVILFDKSREEYPLIETDFEGAKRIRTISPVYANNATDIAITGNGVLDGSGHLWRPVKRFKMTERQWEVLLKVSPYVFDNNGSAVWMPTKSSYEGKIYGEVFPDHEGALEEAAPFYDFYRPVMLSLKHCNRVLLDGVRFQNSPAWCIHPYFCENVTIKNVQVENPYYAQNGDGIDMESCKNVEVCYCKFTTGDDAICLKAGKGREARKITGPCENIHIHHCYVGRSHGGFVIGSEMSRGVKNVLVEDCTFMDSDVGVRMKSALGRGGVVENITIRNVHMVNIQQEAVIMTMDYVNRSVNFDEPVIASDSPEDVPVFRNIVIEHCNCTNAGNNVRIAGVPGKPYSIREVTFHDCNFAEDKNMELRDCEEIKY